MEVFLSIIIQYGDVAGAVTAIIALLFGMYKFVLKPFASWMNTNLAPFLAAVESFNVLADQINLLTRSMNDLKMQVFPNGGSSLRDAIDRIENSVLLLSADQETTLIESGFAVFTTDQYGAWVGANRELTKLVGRAEGELVGNGWLSCLVNGTAQDVEEDYVATLSKEPVREWPMTVTFVTNTGHEQKCRIQAYPNFDKKKKFIGYRGFVRQF